MSACGPKSSSGSGVASGPTQWPRESSTDSSTTTSVRGVRCSSEAFTPATLSRPATGRERSGRRPC
eukprot:6462599-Alexandrium_andersonii.AAC.1